MVRKRYIPLFFMLAVLMCSCEKVVDFDPGDVSPYVVVVSKPVSDSLVSVYVGYSRFFLDNRGFNGADNATVTITSGSNTAVGTYDPDCFIQSDYYDDWNGYYGDTTHYGGYGFMLRPNPGDTMRVSATVPGYDKIVTAQTVVPPQPQVEIVDLVIDTLDEVTGGYYYCYYSSTYYRLRFRINCNSNREYFSVRVLLGEEIYLSDTVSVWDSTQMSSYYFTVSDPIVNNASLEDAFDGDDGSFSGREMTFSSERFSGGAHEFTMEFDATTYGNRDILGRPVKIEVCALSEELYRYNVTSSGYTSDLDDLFSEPVQVYCNIKGGIGIFGASTKKIFKAPAPRVENFNNSASYYKKKKK